MTQVDSIRVKGRDGKNSFLEENMLASTFLLKRIEDLLKLGVCPEAWQN
jgi:hypothetical protein